MAKTPNPPAPTAIDLPRPKRQRRAATPAWGKTPGKGHRQYPRANGPTYSSRNSPPDKPCEFAFRRAPQPRPRFCPCGQGGNHKSPRVVALALHFLPKPTKLVILSEAQRSRRTRGCFSLRLCFSFFHSPRESAFPKGAGAFRPLKGGPCSYAEKLRLTQSSWRHGIPNQLNTVSRIAQNHLKHLIRQIAVAIQLIQHF